jgi:L-fuconolactonase
MVDAHHHFWNPVRTAQPWMTGRFEPLARRFEPPDLEHLLRTAGVAETVLVQSAAHDEDTDYMFELAEGVEWIGGIVAWLRLDDSEVAHDRLRELRTRPKLRGIRHLIHLETDPHWILRREVEDGLSQLEEAALKLDLPAEFPNQLGDVPELARRHPGLVLVIDHLAKPPREAAGFELWREQLAAAAELPNVFAKVSGLDTGVELAAAVEAAVASFGPERLMFGSDWPVSLLTGSYVEVVERTVSAIRDAAGDRADEILAGTARRVYGLA